VCLLEGYALHVPTIFDWRDVKKQLPTRGRGLGKTCGNCITTKQFCRETLVDVQLLYGDGFIIYLPLLSMACSVQREGPEEHDGVTAESAPF
jgi:hypothetical protein